MPGQQLQTVQVHKTKEVLDVVFPSGDQAGEVVHPGKEPLCFPASAVTTQLASILTFASAPPIGRDQLDSVPFRELGIERIRVVGFVTDEARGRLLSAATAMIFVPLPRRVGPTAKPPFSRSRRWHPRTPLPDSAVLAHADAEPAASKPVPASRSGPTVGTGGGMSGMEDISPAVPATAPRYPKSRTRP
jgi:hypothetical protein